jgi:3-deoxy-7-phosphoheptulonate synthase
MVLVDFHPAPGQALVDGPQALKLEELSHFLEDVAVAREAYGKRLALAERYGSHADLPTHVAS